MVNDVRIAVLDDYQGVALSCADWSGLDVTVFRSSVSPAELQDFEVLVAMRERTAFPAEVLGALPRLRLLVTTGPRNAAIDLAAAAARGITVCGTASGSTPPAELTWALILGLARHLLPEATAFRGGGPWQSTVGVDLAGATLGVVGLGRIGSQVARVGLAFGMDVVAWSQHLTDERCAEVGVRRAASLVDLLAAAHVVTLHLILGKTTRGLIGRSELAAMKPSAYFVNTSRSGLVDTDALVEALRNGRIAGAGLDVYDVEPVPADHPLRTLPNVLGTPHLGYVSAVNYRTYFSESVEDIRTWLDGAPIRVIT
jgi:phosphoglycerate dehydrogenase-like enzyme